MRRFFENRVAFAATVIAFATATAVTALFGNAIAPPSLLPTVKISVNALPGLPPFDCQGCPPAAAAMTASVQALPGLPPFDCQARQPAAVQALPGLPPFDRQGCPPAAAAM